MERFLNLIKKKLVGEATQEDEAELSRLLYNNEERKELYTILFSKNLDKQEIDWLAAEQAYAAHYVKMQSGKQPD